MNLFLALLLNAFDSEDEDDGEDGSDGEQKEPIQEWLKRKLLTTRRWVVPLKNPVTQTTANGSATNEVHSPGKKTTVVKVQKPIPHRELSTADAGENFLSDVLKHLGHVVPNPCFCSH